MENTSKTNIVTLSSPITRTYIAHASVMAIKLLCYNPLLFNSVASWAKIGTFIEADVLRRAYLAELKCLVPFWVLGALYVTIDPPLKIAQKLFRTFSIARFIAHMGYYSNHLHEYCADMAEMVSYVITVYMAVWVIAHYINFL